MAAKGSLWQHWARVRASVGMNAFACLCNCMHAKGSVTLHALRSPEGGMGGCAYNLQDPPMHGIWVPACKLPLPAKSAG